MRAFLVVALLPALVLAQTRQHLPGLRAEAQIVRDRNGIAHIQAANEHDLFFLQGFVHAQDRLFQMDVTRRRASGTLAELLGPAALSGDVLLRTLGLRRAAERSLPIQFDRARAAVDAYTEGVNAFVVHNPLPPEYAALELTRFAPWTAIDSIAVGKIIGFGLSFDLDDIGRTTALVSYQKAGAALGFDGTALFFQDLFRSAPFDPASTIPDASQAPPRAPSRGPAADAQALHPRTVEMAAQFLDQVKADAFLRRLVSGDDRDGSNQWAIAGRNSESGHPLLASDPHLALGAPSTFHPIHLQAPGFDAIGNSFPGAPLVIVGHNRRVAWGATVNPLDVTDVFQEAIVSDPASPSGLSTLFKGAKEPVIPIPERFFVNLAGDGVLDDVVPVPAGNGIPAATLIVPRRNAGPLVQLDLAHGIGLSVQYTGFSATREFETFLRFDTARTIADIGDAVKFFNVGSQNFVCADVDGNIAYFTGSDVPVREDLQAGFVAGLPPFFIRNGTGGNEWLAVQHPQPAQAIPFEILPQAEMPHIVNPPGGFLVNANNDPIGITLGNSPLSRLRPGGGIYYLNPAYDFGERAGRITRRVRERLEKGRISFRDMQSIQADVKLLDAEVFVPRIVAAFLSALRQGAPAPLAGQAVANGVAEAVARLALWDFSTPTGIPEGFDASDDRGNRHAPRRGEIEASVAATIYAVFRGELVREVIDSKLAPVGLPIPGSQQAMTALRNLFDNFDRRKGIGASGIDFFAVPRTTPEPMTAEDRRDFVVLHSLAQALSRLAGPDFAGAFGRSTDQTDYRWGRLHRIVFSHPLGGAFDVPPAFGFFPPPLPDLRGIPTDGGFATVDASAHDVRAASTDGFFFTSGPSNRLVVELRPDHVRAESVWPGGVSAVPGNPHYVDLLPLWLTNETVPLPFDDDAEGVVQRFAP